MSTPLERIRGALENPTEKNRLDALAAVRELEDPKPTPALLRAWAELPEMKALEVFDCDDYSKAAPDWLEKLADALERAEDHG